MYLHQPSTILCKYLLLFEYLYDISYASSAVPPVLPVSILHAPAISHASLNPLLQIPSSSQSQITSPFLPPMPTYESVSVNASTVMLAPGPQASIAPYTPLFSGVGVPSPRPSIHSTCGTHCSHHSPYTAWLVHHPPPQ